MLPNSSRQAWVTVDTGFQSTNVFSGPENDSCGTNALETNVSGKITMNDALLTTSTLGTMSPTRAMIQLIA